MARLKNPRDPFASEEDYQEMVARKRPAAPTCCGSSVEKAVVRIALDAQGKPYWAALGFCETFWMQTQLHPVSVCPFCGASLPEIVVRKPAVKPLGRDNDDGYCATCKERCRDCLCHCPTHRWEGKPQEEVKEDHEQQQQVPAADAPAMAIGPRRRVRRPRKE